MYARKFRAPTEEFHGKAKKIFSSEYFLLKAAPNDKQYNRFSVVIPASSAKSSVRRHFWKRKMAEHLVRWPNFKKDFLFIVLPNIKNLSPENLEAEVGRALKKAQTR